MAGIKRQFDVARARDRLRRRMKTIVDETKAEIAPEMAETAKDIVGLMRRLVPFKSGKLRRSIDWSFGNPPPTKATGAFRPKPAKNSKGLRISIYAGDDEAFYARWVEFGTQPSVKGEKVQNAAGRKRKAGRTHPGTTAQPFFFPAWRLKKKDAKKAVAKAVRAAVKKATTVS